jgi:hypothetical protein
MLSFTLPLFIHHRNLDEPFDTISVDAFHFICYTRLHHYHTQLRRHRFRRFTLPISCRPLSTLLFDQLYPVCEKEDAYVGIDFLLFAR